MITLSDHPWTVPFMQLKSSNNLSLGIWQVKLFPATFSSSFFTSNGRCPLTQKTPRPPSVSLFFLSFSPIPDTHVRELWKKEKEFILISDKIKWLSMEAKFITNRRSHVQFLLTPIWSMTIQSWICSLTCLLEASGRSILFLFCGYELAKLKSKGVRIFPPLRIQGKKGKENVSRMYMYL